MPTDPTEHLAEIARACEYHDGAGFPDVHPDDDDCPVDNLIAYKDALEGEVGRLLRERIPAPGEFTMRINLGNVAMQTPRDVAGALRAAADVLENGPTPSQVRQIIRDENGNTVGDYIYVPPPADDPAPDEYEVGTDDVPRDVYDPHRDDAP